MAETTEYDLIVIGGGPAGYAGAIRAGQLGKKVACIESERAGGTCLNWGCIPTKALLKSAELYQKIKKADAFGITVKDVTFDFAKVMERSRGVSQQMAKGIEFLFKKNKVDYFVGRGQVPAAGMVEITEGEHKGKFFKTKAILIATGCKMRRIPDLEVDGARVMLTWDFEFHFRGWRPQVTQNIHGASLITLDAAGLVAVHRDYWDAAEELYEKLPLLGALLRLLKQQGRPKAPL